MVLVLRPRVLVLVFVLTKKSYLHHCTRIHRYTLVHIVLKFKAERSILDTYSRTTLYDLSKFSFGLAVS